MPKSLPAPSPTRTGTRSGTSHRSSISRSTSTVSGAGPRNQAAAPLQRFLAAGMSLRVHHAVVSDPAGRSSAYLLGHRRAVPAAQVRVRRGGHRRPELHLAATCDHEWEARHLWTEGLQTRPSEHVHRQMLRELLVRGPAASSCGTTSASTTSCGSRTSRTWRRSTRAPGRRAEEGAGGVSDEDRRKLLYENAIRVYGMSRR